jgi:hypothetical protein
VVDTYDPRDPRANQQAFIVDPPNYEFRATIALMFALMFCLPIVGGLIAILAARSVLRTAVPTSRTARITSRVAIVLGALNCLMWSIFLVQKATGTLPDGDRPFAPTTVPINRGR